jgi:hypothetical protein
MRKQRPAHKSGNEVALAKRDRDPCDGQGCSINIYGCASTILVACGPQSGKDRFGERLWLPKCAVHSTQHILAR